MVYSADPVFGNLAGAAINDTTECPSQPPANAPALAGAGSSLQRSHTSSSRSVVGAAVGEQ